MDSVTQNLELLDMLGKLPAIFKSLLTSMERSSLFSRKKTP